MYWGNYIRFQAAEQFFREVDNSSRKQDEKWHPYYNQSQPLDVYLDYDGRKCLKNMIPNKKIYIQITLNILIPYEIQVPIFYLENTKNTITTFFFMNQFGIGKPYFKNDKQNGILDDFKNKTEIHPYIQCFAKNVLRILKLSTNPLIKYNDLNNQNNLYLFNATVEISAMILSTERIRSEKSLLIAYIEFNKLKHTKNINDSKERLINMFNKQDSLLIFPENGGSKKVRSEKPIYFYDQFISMLYFSPVYDNFKKLPKPMQYELREEFYEGKLDKLKSMSADRPSLYQSKFKIFVLRSEKFIYLKYKRIFTAWKKVIKAARL